MEGGLSYQISTIKWIKDSKLKSDVYYMILCMQSFKTVTALSINTMLFKSVLLLHIAMDSHVYLKYKTCIWMVSANLGIKKWLERDRLEEEYADTLYSQYLFILKKMRKWDIKRNSKIRFDKAYCEYLLFCMPSVACNCSLCKTQCCNTMVLSQKDAYVN